MEVRFVKERLFDAGFGLTSSRTREHTLLLTNSQTGEILSGRHYARSVLDKWAPALRIVEELGADGFTSGGQPVLIQTAKAIG